MASASVIRMSVPRSLLAEVVVESQPLHAVQRHVSRTFQAVAVDVEREGDLCLAFPVARLVARLGDRLAGSRLTDPAYGLQFVAHQVAVAEARSVAAAEKGRQRADQLPVELLDRQHDFLLFGGTRTFDVVRPLLRPHPRADKALKRDRFLRAIVLRAYRARRHDEQREARKA